MAIRGSRSLLAALGVALGAGCGGQPGGAAPAALVGPTSTAAGSATSNPTRPPPGAHVAPVPVALGPGGPSLAPVETLLGITAHPPLGADPDATLLRARDLDAIAAAGFRVLRVDFSWDLIEPVRGRFDFAAQDRLVADASARGIEVLAILCYGNPWATRWGFLRDPLFPPDDPADFGRFAGETAAHFRGRLRGLEVWNEQNAGPRFWKPFASARAYGDLLAAAHGAIRIADPAVPVVFGGTFWSEVPPLFPGTLGFTADFFRSRPNGAALFDAYAYHPYRYPFRAPEAAGLPLLPGQETQDEGLFQVRALLARHGAARAPVWVSEQGWHTARWSLPYVGVDERAQARYLVRSEAAALAQGVGLYVWYTLRDGPRHDHWQEDAFGLLAHDPDPLDATPARRKPAYEAHRTLAARLAATRPDGDVRRSVGLGVEGRAWRFRGVPGREVTVLWTVRAAPAGTLARVPVPPGATTLERVALDGSATPLAAVPAPGGGLVVEVSPSEDPVLIDLR
ncbi:MAG: beta-galactosidase [Planctomycetes bacterium]|nr:beta-galactosidase [Planctomycetota bacterium]